MTRARTWLALVAALVAVLAVGAPVHAKGRPGANAGAAAKAKGHVAVGRVQSVSAGSLTLQLRNGRTATFTVTDKTRIRVDGKKAPLAAIQVGFMAVVLHRGAAARAIRAGQHVRLPGSRRHHVLVGRVQSVGAGSLTFQTRAGKTVTVAVTDKTRIVVIGQAGSLGQIQAGYYVAVLRAKDGSARAIRASATAPQPQGLVVRGRVQSVAGDSLTLALRNGAMLTVTVGAQAKVFVNGQAGSVAQIQPGWVAVVFRAPDGTVLGVLAHAPR